MISPAVITDLDQLMGHARSIAQMAETGDVICLQGDLGAGKTEWARAFVRALTTFDQPVPSPTFSLVQTYQASSFTIWHFDLYRLEHGHDVWELGLEEALAQGVSLIEWPQRLHNIHLHQHLLIKIDLDTLTQHRIITLQPDMTWQRRLATNLC